MARRNMPLRLSAEQADRLEAVARAEGISVSDAVREAIEEHIDRNRKDARPPAGQAVGQLVIKGKTIPILSYSVGASNPATIAVGGGGVGAGKANFSSLNMMKEVDATSAALFKALATGEHFKEATLTAHWGSGATAATMSYKLESVVVESVQQSGGGGTPAESLSLAFAKMTWKYTDPSGTTSGSWDLSANKP